jgi:hypothetical protein
VIFRGRLFMWWATKTLGKSRLQETEARAAAAAAATARLLRDAEENRRKSESLYARASAVHAAVSGDEPRPQED